MGKNKFFFIVLFAVAVIGLAFLIYKPPASPEMIAFAECLGERGATFYGAFWCPHCQNQKAMFGSADKYLPYIECSTPDGRGQLPICQEANVTGYPTWEFADGSRLSGEIPIRTLAEKTGCAAPE